MKIIESKQVFQDARGGLASISAGTAWKEINLFTSKRGGVRGNHYHKKTLELIFILEGRIEFRIRHLKTGAQQTSVLAANQGILIEPWELHTAIILEDSKNLNLLTEPYDSKNPDVFGPEDS